MKERTKLASYLKKARLKSGLSQPQVAEALRYSTYQFVSNWERGISSPPLDAIPRLITLYSLDRDEVISVILDDTRTNLENAIKVHGVTKKTTR